MPPKYHWFSHENDARNDEFIQRSEDRFSHFGYSAYFKILELIHSQGTAGSLKISKSRLALNLRSRWPQVQQYLDFSRTSGKLQIDFRGDEVHLQNKKFIERNKHLMSACRPLGVGSVVHSRLYDRIEEIEKKQPPLPPSEVGTSGRRPKTVFTPAFEKFWEAYPKKSGKISAFEVFTKMRLAASVPKLLEAIDHQTSAGKFHDKKFILDPERWLKRGKWMDEIERDENLIDDSTARKLAFVARLNEEARKR